MGAGCPCAVRITGEDGAADRPIIPDIRGLTIKVHEAISKSEACKAAYAKLTTTFAEDNVVDANIEAMLNRIRSFREVAGNAGVRSLSFQELDGLDRAICEIIREVVTCSLPSHLTPYHALAAYIGSHHTPFTEIFTTNYDVLIEQALEHHRVPFF